MKTCCKKSHLWQVNFVELIGPSQNGGKSNHFQIFRDNAGLETLLQLVILFVFGDTNFCGFV